MTVEIPSNDDYTIPKFDANANDKNRSTSTSGSSDRNCSTTTPEFSESSNRNHSTFTSESSDRNRRASTSTTRITSRFKVISIMMMLYSIHTLNYI